MTPCDLAPARRSNSSKATRISARRLTDETQNWEKSRWKGYWVKYRPDRVFRNGPVPDQLLLADRCLTATQLVQRGGRPAESPPAKR